MIRPSIPIVLFGLNLLIGVALIFWFDGTGDNGDSVMHYLYARYAPQHPELYFDHWGKPVFTMLASLFAQFGFSGMKVFNLLITTISAFLTFMTARSLGMRSPWMAMLIMLACPFGMVVALSGLTEPLFGLFLIVGILLMSRKQYELSAMVVSFLPFVRSEGLLIMMVFGAYFLSRKDWRAIASLAVGHLVLGLVGWLHYGSPFWVITEIPYATTDSVYGSGPLFEMVFRLYFVIGIPVAALLVMGTIAVPAKLIVHPKDVKPPIVVALAAVLAMLVFHSVARYGGMFNSMGLKRVFVAVIPCIGLVGLAGFTALMDAATRLHSKAAYFLSIATVIALIGFPFTSNHTALHRKQFELMPNQRLAATMMMELFPSGIPEGKTVFYFPVCYAESLQIDHFDPNMHRNLNQFAPEYFRSGDIILWDSDTPGHPAALSLDQLTQESCYQLASYSETLNGKTLELIVFQVR